MFPNNFLIVNKGSYEPINNFVFLILIYHNNLSFKLHMQSELGLKITTWQYLTLARNTLKGKFLPTALITLLIIIVPSTAQFYLTQFFGFMIPIVFMSSLIFPLGLCAFYLQIVKKNQIKVSKLWEHCNDLNLLIQSILLYFTKVLIISLGCFLLVIPGVLFLCMFSMSFFVLVDNPSLNFIQAMKKSTKMMVNRKWKLFKIFLLLIVLNFMGFLCLLIGELFAMPLTNTMLAIFYQSNKIHEPEQADLTDNQPDQKKAD